MFFKNSEPSGQEDTESAWLVFYVAAERSVWEINDLVHPFFSPMVNPLFFSCPLLKEIIGEII